MATQRSATAAFSSGEWAIAVLAAFFIEGLVMGLLAMAGTAGSVVPDEEALQAELPIQVLPVLDDAPLLKLGSKRRENQLPEMWRKPKPKKRYEDKSAPAVDAKKQLDKLPENEVAQKDEDPAPEDAELAKRVDEDIPEEENPEEGHLPEEGEEDGVKEGTETNALKAFVVSQYRVKIQAWFKAGFSVPTELDEALACQLSAKVHAVIGPDRTVVSFDVTPSGNSVFDGRVRSHMAGKQGQQIPPPPPNYGEAVVPGVNLNFSGETAACKKKQRGIVGQPQSPEGAPDVESPAE